MDSDNRFIRNLEYFQKNNIYAGTGRDEFNKLFPDIPVQDNTPIDPRSLFQSNVSEDTIATVKRNGKNALGMYGYNNNGDLIEIDENLIFEILQELEQRKVTNFSTTMENNNKLDKNGYRVEGLPPIPFYMLKLVQRSGPKALYKQMKNPDPTKPDIKITPKLYQASLEAIEYLCEEYGSLEAAERLHREVYNKYSTYSTRFINKRAGDDTNAVLTTSFDSTLEEEPVSLEKPQDLYSNASLFDEFMAEPNKTNFAKLLDAVGNTLGEGDTFGRNATTELLELAEQAGVDWITEENVEFLYELFNL